METGSRMCRGEQKGGKAVREKLLRLVDVKSLVTFALIVVVCVQSVRHNIEMPPEFVASIVSAIVTYYFTRREGEK